MKKFIATLLVTTMSLPAFAQVSGGLDVKSAYVLDDAVVATPSPVVQGYGSIEVLQDFTLNVWGSKGITEDTGDEIDVGAAYITEVGEGVTMKVVANRYFLRDAPDMWELTAGLAKGNYDVSLTHYTWEGGLEDGMRVQLGYNFDLSEKWSGRTELTAETGLELSDSLIVGNDISYQLTEKVSVTGTIYIPVIESDFRGVEALIGLSRSF